ncbi:protein of unknown function [Methanoculleus bourgensis]|uniref:Uncharacterized protein n=1 Tax=Methanoculleus bourgensis TaxID=83986 RepID=A0A0X3BHB1_9EURY|nr:protein of unknown function [Methanoculleus bourgensis]
MSSGALQLNFPRRPPWVGDRAAPLLCSIVPPGPGCAGRGLAPSRAGMWREGAHAPSPARVSRGKLRVPASSLSLYPMNAPAWLSARGW